MPPVLKLEDSGRLRDWKKIWKGADQVCERCPCRQAQASDARTSKFLLLDTICDCPERQWLRY